MKRKLALLATALLLALIGAELFVRAAMADELRSIYALDPVSLHRLIPGASHVYRRDTANGSHAVTVSINEDGFRGPPLRDDGALRIVVFGDSFVLAEYTELDETFCVRLESRLAEALGRPVEVVNAGVSGYGPDQCLVRIDRELEKLEPDLVVLAVFGGNDLGDLMRNKLFRLDDGGALIENHPQIADTVTREFAAAAHPSYLWRLVHKLRRNQRLASSWRALAGDDDHSRLEAAQRLVEASRQQCEGDYRGFVVDRDDRVRNLLGDQYDADIALQPERDSARYKIALFRAVLRRIAKRLGEVPSLVVAIPAATDACDLYLSGTVDTDAWPDYDRAHLTSVVAAAAAGCELDCLDLFRPFRAGGNDLYLEAPDGHWNSRGQDLAAQIVAERLLEGPLREQLAHGR